MTTLKKYSGSKFIHRLESHIDEISEGKLWHKCGCSSETGTLREVLLSWPSEKINFEGSADKYLMINKPDFKLLCKQTETLAKFYESQGIRVHLYKKSEVPPNFIFMRDLFWTTPEGVVISRPAAKQRAGEERFAAEAIANIGIPILFSFRSNATFEGADALWLDEKTVLLGTGGRTNDEGARQISNFLRSCGIITIIINLPQEIQHLLGVVNFLDKDLVALHKEKATDTLKDILYKRQVKTIELPPDNELICGRGMNFITLSKRCILMPSECPGIRKRFEKEGVEIFEINVSEYIKAAGGIGCLTGIILRDK